MQFVYNLFSSTNNFAYAQTLYRMSSLCRSYECMTIARVNIGLLTGWKNIKQWRICFVLGYLRMILWKMQLIEKCWWIWYLKPNYKTIMMTFQCTIIENEKCCRIYGAVLMGEIWYLVTSVIYVYHIVGSVFGPVRFLLPACRLCWFLYNNKCYILYIFTIKTLSKHFWVFTILVN
jgi:hypothetical protein